MENSLFLKLIAVVLIIVGIMLVWNPELVSKKAIPTNAFDAIERRVWWGLLIGLGSMLLFHRQLQPWTMTIAAMGSSLFVGLLVARLIGIMLDGSVVKQWIYVGIEIVIMVPFIWWYFSFRR